MNCGGNTAGMLAEAASTSRNSSRALGAPLAAMAPMFQITARWESRLVVTTSRRRPLACSSATALSRSGVT